MQAGGSADTDQQGQFCLSTAAEAAVEAQALREQLDSYIAAAATLSPATLAKVEAQQSVQVTLR